MRFAHFVAQKSAPFRSPLNLALGFRMHFWNIKDLSKELARDLVSESMGMKYLLAFTLLGLFSTYLSLWMGAVRNWLFYFELVVLSVIAIFGCLQAFAANGGNVGRSFVLRAICISVPASIRVSLFSVVFALITYFTFDHVFTGENFGDPLRAYTLISYSVFVGLSIYFWALIVSGFKDVRTYEQQT